MYAIIRYMAGKALVAQQVDIDHFPENKRLYLYYRVWGLNPAESMRMIGLKYITLSSWKNDDKDFKEVEQYVEKNGHELKEKSLTAIDKVIDTGILRHALKIHFIDPVTDNKETVALMKWAVDTWFKRRGKAISGEDSYDELILKKHRRVG